VDITPAMRDYAQKKLGKLSDFNGDLRTAEVTYKIEPHSAAHKVEVMLIGDGVRLRAEERRPDVYEAVDYVMEKLEQQVKKHHKRQIDRNRHHSAKEVPAGFAAATAPNPSDYGEPRPAEPDQADNQPLRITRRKRFAMKPMSPGDAALEMDMMGHEFFVFRNTGGDVNVVYRRTDGSCGLIEVGE
jgi:putative sigma-54 modulation protein